jgi:hypothetical protein
VICDLKGYHRLHGMITDDHRPGFFAMAMAGRKEGRKVYTRHGPLVNAGVESIGAVAYSESKLAYAIPSRDPKYSTSKIELQFPRIVALRNPIKRFVRRNANNFTYYYYKLLEPGFEDNVI